MRRFAAVSVLVPALLIGAGCVSRPAPRVTFLADGVFKSPTAQDAENYCRNFRAPMRFLSCTVSEVLGESVPAGEEL